MSGAVVRGALITGGTSGIGRACVERLVADGWRVVFTGRDRGRGDAVAHATGATFLEADATDRAAADRSVSRAVELLGRIDLLVANAGILFVGQVTETTEAEFLATIETNLTATFRYARAVFGAMRESGGGSIVVVASDAALRGSHRVGAYSIAKAGAVAVAELFGAEGAPHRIRANAVCPGNTLPGMAGDDPAGWRATASGRFAEPGEVAAAVAWLASDEARHVNGAALRIDGGTGAALQVVTRG